MYVVNWIFYIEEKKRRKYLEYHFHLFMVDKLCIGNGALRDFLLLVQL